MQQTAIQYNMHHYKHALLHFPHCPMTMVIWVMGYDIDLQKSTWKGWKQTGIAGAKFLTSQMSFLMLNQQCQKH